MKNWQSTTIRALAVATVAALGTSAWALTGTEVGATGRTYASAGVQCAVHPVAGMAPMVQAGLYNPKKSSTANVSHNGSAVATVSFVSPDTSVWLANGANAVVVTLDKRTADTYNFDASPTYAGQRNVCIPDTGGNTVSGDLEYAASLKSYATRVPGCALNPLTGRGQPYVHLFDNGGYLLNVSVNNVPLTQLSSTRTHTPVFLGPGLNVISASNASASTDYYVRDGGAGTCNLP